MAETETPYAVALMHLPKTGETYHTPFSGERYEDPLSMAHLFREAEEERGDFPGALWAVAGNEAAGEIRKRTLLAMVGL
jgi:hypothetical protein